MKSIPILNHLYSKSVQGMFVLSLLLSGLGLLSGALSQNADSALWSKSLIETSLQLLVFSLVLPWFFPLIFGEWLYTRSVKPQDLIHTMQKKLLLYGGVLGGTNILFLVWMHTWSEASDYGFNWIYGLYWSGLCFVLIACLKSSLKLNLFLIPLTFSLLMAYAMGSPTGVLAILGLSVLSLGLWGVFNGAHSPNLLPKQAFYVEAIYPENHEASVGRSLLKPTPGFWGRFRFVTGQGLKTYGILLGFTLVLSLLSALIFGLPQLWTSLISSGIGNPISPFSVGATYFDLLWAIALLIGLFHFKYSMRQNLEYFQTRPVSMTSLYLKNWGLQAAIMLGLTFIATLVYPMSDFYLKELVGTANLKLFPILLLTFFFVLGGEMTWVIFAMLGFLDGFTGAGLLHTGMLLIHTPSLWASLMWLPVLAYRIYDLFSFTQKTQQFAHEGLFSTMKHQGKVYELSLLLFLTGIGVFMTQHPFYDWDRYTPEKPYTFEVSRHLYLHQKVKSEPVNQWELPGVASRSDFIALIHQGLKAHDVNAVRAKMLKIYYESYILPRDYDIQRFYMPSSERIPIPHGDWDMSDPYLQALYALAQKQDERAVQNLELLVKNEPSVLHLRLLALVYTHQMRYSEAHSVYKRMLEKYPNYRRHIEQAQAELFLFQGKHAKALDMYTQQLQTLPPFSYPGFTLELQRVPFHELGLCSKLPPLLAASKWPDLSRFLNTESEICRGTKIRSLDFDAHGLYHNLLSRFESNPKSLQTFVKTYLYQRVLNGRYKTVYFPTSLRMRNDAHLAQKWFELLPSAESAKVYLVMSFQPELALKDIASAGLQADVEPLYKELKHLYAMAQKQGAEINAYNPNLTGVLWTQYGATSRKEFPILSQLCN